jgi:hypothetical protein
MRQTAHRILNNPDAPHSEDLPESLHAVFSGAGKNDPDPMMLHCFGKRKHQDVHRPSVFRERIGMDVKKKAIFRERDRNIFVPSSHIADPSFKKIAVDSPFYMNRTVFV